MPGAAQAGYASAVRKRKKRIAVAYERVYTHTGDERLREIWTHWGRHLRLMQKVRMFLVKTEKMMADIFTKPLGKSAYLRCRDYLMTAIGKIA